MVQRRKRLLDNSFNDFIDKGSASFISQKTPLKTEETENKFTLDFKNVLLTPNSATKSSITSASSSSTFKSPQIFPTLKAPSYIVNGLISPSKSPAKRKKSIDSSNIKEEEQGGSPLKKKLINKYHNTTEIKNENDTLNFFPRKKLMFQDDENLDAYSQIKTIFQKSSGVPLNTDSDPNTLCRNGKTNTILVSRNQEYEQIMTFLNNSIEQDTGDSLYITGPPGTGKTAQVTEIINSHFNKAIVPPSNNHNNNNNNNNNNGEILNKCLYQNKYAVTTCIINCIALKSPHDIFSKLYHSFINPQHDTNSNNSVKTMDDLRLFLKKYKKKDQASTENLKFIIVLDEMDKLVNSSNLGDTRTTATIFNLFLMAKLPELNFILIGISNSLDMKDRFLSRLELGLNLQPKTLIFKPYDAAQIYDIVMNKLHNNKDTTFNVDKYIQPMAIRFLSRKISSTTGDLRKVFDILRKSIEMLELTYRQKMSNTTDNTNETPLKLTIAHVSKVCNTYFNSHTTKERMKNLNIQQKIALCCLIKQECGNIPHDKLSYSNPELYYSMDSCYDYYYYTLTVAIPDIMTPCNRNEYKDLIYALETFGLCHITMVKASPKHKNQVLKKLSSNIDRGQFEMEISKVNLLKKFL
ncbi:uncharacterized protein SCODWIG_02171 [Saccharomycodes ludwigii]|uniref:Cell division control protein n=1 Tax=Saccharomycodes ludwigii TaxID=36035 RepID=A0A376B8E9_9ASCO|nr:hypothetical protein SCDLUD_004031 [Saccharomycodes ludwigii]KAH3899745.1 hypothetical protein SCDLUD_004031 [Saccharomycodes ludwigii]SSD60410.1 uncharacterized protein SCODWIG_02171 [Saccharomycodes ludwigii]